MQESDVWYKQASNYSNLSAPQPSQKTSQFYSVNKSSA